ncbi:Mucin 68D [Carabus blaptoides fortunei]
MKALLTLIFLTFLVGQITASDSRLSRKCLNGITSRFKCCKGVPNSWYAHLKNPKDCGTFYQCDNGKPVLRDCPKDLEWSVAADRCEHPKYARCSSNGSDSNEESGESGEFEPLLPEECYEGKLGAKKCCKGISEWWVHLPDPEDCTKFYHCDNGKAVHKDCPANLHWSVTTNRCEWPYLAGCQGEQPTTYPADTTQKPSEPATKPTEATEQPTEEPVVLPEGCYDGSISAEACCEGVTDWWVHLPDPENCGKFYQCDNGQAVHKDCPAGLHWSVTADKCEWPDIAGCQTSATEPNTGNTDGTTNGITEDPISTETPVRPEGCYDGSISADACCEGVTAWWVHLPDPENCGKFYQCDNGQAVHKDCPAGLHWSVTADRCEWPDIAGCQTSSTEPNTGILVDRPMDTQMIPSLLKPQSSQMDVTMEAVHKDCPAGLHWSVTADRCEWPDIAGCQTSSTEPNTGTTDGTTNANTDGPISTESPVLPEGCYDGSISAEVCCEGVTGWWVHLPDPENCGMFYQCDNGHAVHKDCPAGLHWSVTADRCEWPDIAGCQTSSTEPNTGNTDVTTDVTTEGTVEDNCSPTPVPHQCYTGYFSAQLCCEGIKDWQKIHLAHPQDCTSYYDCINEAAILRKCPEGLHWSINTDRCEWPIHAQCSNSTGNENESEGGNEGEEGNNNGSVSEGCLYGEVDPNICCEDVPDTVNVLLQNNDNCHTYYQCVHGKPKVRPCPASLWWSVKNNRCEWRRNATCTWEIKY